MKEMNEADISEQDLVIGLRANEPFYQNLLVDRYAGRLLSIVLLLGMSRQDGIEVVNDTLYKIIKNIGKFDLSKGYKFSTWIARIATNTARDKYRQIQNNLELDSIDERAERGIQDSESFWHEEASNDSAIYQLSQKILIEALESLSETDQDILRLYACGFHHKEVAALLKKTTGSVKTGHFRAKERLKQKYIDIVDSNKNKSTVMAIKDFLGIEAENEKTAN